MIQNSRSYRDIIAGLDGGGWSVDSSKQIKRKTPPTTPNLTLINRIICESKKDLYTDPWDWSPKIDALYPGMIVFVKEIEEYYVLEDPEKWKQEEGWQLLRSESDEEARLRKIDNLL